MHGLDLGGSLPQQAGCCLSPQSFVSSTGLFHLPFKGSLISSKVLPWVSGTKDQEDNKEASEDNTNTGS